MVLYKNDSNNLARYVIGVSGSKPMICFGVNPSYANPEKLDPTTRQIMKLSSINGYDGWIMLNLYPQRTSDPKLIHMKIDLELHNSNLKYIFNVLNEYKPTEIFALWGNSIELRPFLKQSLKEINKEVINRKISWKSIGGLTNKGNPWHPRYLFIRNNQIKEYSLLKKFFTFEVK